MGGRFAGWLTGGGVGCPGRLAFGWLPGCPVVGVAGLPGGASLTIGCAAAVPVGRKLCISRGATGCPGCAARACCCVANGTGGGVGVFFAITCRFITAAGGAGT